MINSVETHVQENFIFTQWQLLSGDSCLVETKSMTVIYPLIRHCVEFNCNMAIYVNMRINKTFVSQMYISQVENTAKIIFLQL